MTIEEGATEAVVKIRVQTRRAWIVFLVIGGCYLAMAALILTGGWPWFLLILIPLPIGFCIIAFALALRTLGVDLTPEFAVVRGFRRRHEVPWLDVQAVVSHLNSNGTSAGLAPSGERWVSGPAISDVFVAKGRCHVRRQLPTHRPVVARAPRRVLAPCPP